jgi:autotransporter-associated beta strand protein
MLKGATAGAGEIAGAISDPSPGKTTSLTKSGTGIWKLSGLNSFSGATKVQAGTLVCTSASSPGTGTMDITTGAKLQLDYIGTRQVAALTFNLGSAQPNGTYGSTASSATNKNDTCFSGTGTLTVGPVTTIQYVLTVVAAPSHGGMVAGGGTCDQGTLRAITATPNSGWQFAGWIGKGVTAPGAATTTVLMNGGKSLTANFTALDSYASWAGDPAQGLTAGVNDGPNDDPDLDGIPNLLECALAGPPMVASRAILPVLAKQPGTWTFEYDRSVLSRPPATTQIVEYGSDLTGWTQVTIPAESNGIVTVTPGTTIDRVKVTLPTPGARCFARLKLVQPQD